jgi:hypothetical protein
MACMSRHHLPRFNKSSGLDTHLVSGLMPGAPKVRIVQYRDIGLHHSPPRMKNQHGLMRKKPLNSIKNDPQLSANDVFHVQVVWILTTKRKSLLRVENVKGLKSP